MDRRTMEETAAGQAAADRANTDRAAAGQAEIGRADTDRAEIGRQAAGWADADWAGRAAYPALVAALDGMAEEGYRAFSERLIPAGPPLRGVRLPQLQRLAAAIARGDAAGFLRAARDDSFEEVVLQGLVIGRLREPGEAVVRRLRAFLPKVANWSICDSTCAGLRQVRRDPQPFWEFALSCLSSPDEFTVRVGAVLLLDHFLDESHIDRVLPALCGVTHEGYYAKMAVAWALSVCFVKFEARTAPLLDQRLDPETRRLTVRKICESRRVAPAVKAALRAGTGRTEK